MVSCCMISKQVEGCWWFFLLEGAEVFDKSFWKFAQPRLQIARCRRLCSHIHAIRAYIVRRCLCCYRFTERTCCTHLSVYPVPTIFSKCESRRNFKFTEARIMSPVTGTLTVLLTEWLPVTCANSRRTCCNLVKVYTNVPSDLDLWPFHLKITSPFTRVKNSIIIKY